MNYGGNGSFPQTQHNQPIYSATSSYPPTPRPPFYRMNDRPSMPQYAGYYQFGPPRHPISVFPHLKTVAPPPMGPALQQMNNERPLSQPPRFGFPVQSRSERGRGRSNIVNKNLHSRYNKQSSKPKTKIFCETCDRAFPGEAELAEHLSSHEVCEIDGCQFTAHPKIIAIHVETQHVTGLYKKIVLGTTPEEVTRWREERKRRFPTKANIELKLTAEKERFKRGERIAKPRGRFARQTNWKQSYRLTDQQKKSMNDSETLPNKESFQQSSTSSEPSSVTKKDSIEATNLPSAIASLVANYGTSESDDSDEAPEEATVSRKLEGPPPPETKTRMKDIVMQKKTPQKLTIREQYVRHRRPPTLLQKLLEKEIIHERNVILQCVRHVVQNNFFGKG